MVLPILIRTATSVAPKAIKFFTPVVTKLGTIATKLFGKPSTAIVTSAFAGEKIAETFGIRQGAGFLGNAPPPGSPIGGAGPKFVDDAKKVGAGVGLAGIAILAFLAFSKK